MRLLLAILALLTTTANAEIIGWKLFLIRASGSVHLQTHSEPRWAGNPILFISREGCTELGVKIIAAAKDYPTYYVGFYCEEETTRQKRTSASEKSEH